MALIDAVHPVASIIGDSCANDGAEDKPMQITDDSKEYIFPGKGIGILFLQERKVGVVLRIGEHTSYYSDTNYDKPGWRNRS